MFPGLGHVPYRSCTAPQNGGLECTVDDLDDLDDLDGVDDLNDPDDVDDLDHDLSEL